MNEAELISQYKITGEGLYHYSYDDKKTFQQKIDANPINPESVKLCRKWLRVFAVKNKKKAEVNSYELKHVVELFYDSYIPHGAFIVAGLVEGFTIYTDGSLNCYFNMKFHTTTNSLLPFYIPVIQFNTYKDVIELLDPNTELKED